MQLTKDKKIIIGSTSLVALGLIYFFLDPSKSTFAPKCPVYLITGHQCPSCGIQRAIHASLHGNFLQALHYNFFLLIALPYLAVAIYCTIFSGKLSDWLRKNILNRKIAFTYIILYCIWWVVRNILGI